MKKEAAENSKKDKKLKEKMEAKNHLDSIIYQSEKTAREAEKMEKPELKDLIKNLNETLPDAKKILADEKSDAENLKKTADEISEKLSALGQKMHELGHDPVAAAGEKKVDATGEPEIVDADKK